MNHYIFMFTVVDGKITVWREFYNPLEVLKVIGNPNPKATTSAS